jgi:hypothetical protein
MSRLAQRRDVAGGNETAVRGQVTAANEGMRWSRDRRLTVALPLDVVGELHRQRSKLHVRTTAKSRILDRVTAYRTGNPAASRWNIADSPRVKRTMQPGRSRDYPIIGLVITVAILGVLRSAIGQVGARLMDAVDPGLVDQAAAAVLSVHGVQAVRELRIRWIWAHPARRGRRHHRGRPDGEPGA